MLSSAIHWVGLVLSCWMAAGLVVGLIVGKIFHERGKIAASIHCPLAAHSPRGLAG